MSPPTSAGAKSLLNQRWIGQSHFNSIWRNRRNGGRRRPACSYRFELGDDHDARDRLLDYIEDYGFIEGLGRLSRRLGPRSGFLGGCALCTRFGCLFLGLCLHGVALCCHSGSGLASRAGLSAFRCLLLPCQCPLFLLGHECLRLGSSADVSTPKNRCARLGPAVNNYINSRNDQIALIHVNARKLWSLEELLERTSQ